MDIFVQLQLFCVKNQRKWDLRMLSGSGTAYSCKVHGTEVSRTSGFFIAREKVEGEDKDAEYVCEENY